MIDREARKKAAETIRHYTCGVISNREFERRYPVARTDPIIWALNDSLWPAYEDVFTHKLVGKNALPREMKKRIARWLMFLYSEKEYQ